MNQSLSPPRQGDAPLARGQESRAKPYLRGTQQALSHGAPQEFSDPDRPRLRPIGLLEKNQPGAQNPSCIVCKLTFPSQGVHTFKGAQSATDQWTSRNSQHFTSMLWPHSRRAGGRQSRILHAP
eukprot:5791917-Karenia_brevis.AAC.1